MHDMGLEMDDENIYNLFLSLYDDMDDGTGFSEQKPLLAHYTSLDILEKILCTDEIWFSNPLFMNDLEELRFGILRGLSSIRTVNAIREALRTESRFHIFDASIENIRVYFEREHLLDTYVFCLSEHRRDDADGLPSMWRGYSRSGSGAALVFDTAKLTEVPASPLILGKVHYGSVEERLEWFAKLATGVAELLQTHHIPDEKLYLAAGAVFDCVKLYSLFSKHRGFEEEREWRVVYMSERDDASKLKPMLHYMNGPRGIEPKLRFRFAPQEGVTAPDFSLDSILSLILLGPCISSPVAVKAVARMLHLLNKSQLVERLSASGIPFRSS